MSLSHTVSIVVSGHASTNVHTHGLRGGTVNRTSITVSIRKHVTCALAADLVPWHRSCNSLGEHGSSVSNTRLGQRHCRDTGLSVTLFLGSCSDAVRDTSQSRPGASCRPDIPNRIGTLRLMEYPESRAALTQDKERGTGRGWTHRDSKPSRQPTEGRTE